MNKELFYKGLEERMGYQLSLGQRQIIEAKDRFVQVLATAGSGKTTTMTAKIGYTIAVLTVPCEKILALSYSKASAVDFKRRFLELFEGKAVEGVHFSTLHAFAFGLVRRHYHQHGLRVKLVDDETANFNRYRFVGDVYYKHVGQFATKEILDELFNEISYVKNALVPLEGYKPKNTGFIVCYEAYENEKKRLELIDFDDMLLIAYRVLDDNKELKNWMQTRFSHVFLDEAQDVNPIQIQLLEQLCEKVTQWVVIGDDDQAIYGFRAADPDFLIDFQKRSEGVNQVQLAINYRCPKSILALATPFIQNNKRRLEKPIEGVFDLQSPIKENAYTSLEMQVEQVMYHLSMLIESGAKYGEIAILSRNQYGMVAFLKALLTAGLPIYIKDDQLGFFNHWVVRDTLHFLALVNRPFNVENHISFLSKVRLFLPKPQQEVLKSCHDLESFLKVLNDVISAKGRAQVKVFRDFMRSANKFTLAQQLRALLVTLDYQKTMIERADRGDYAAAMPLTIWETMCYLAKDYTSYEPFHSGYEIFQQQVSQLKFSHKGKGISLLTLHGAKGLEFDHVLMVDLQKDIIPTREATQNAQILEEERRLFYVGMTRAKKSLDFYYPKMSPSQFIISLKTTIDNMKNGGLQVNDVMDANRSHLITSLHQLLALPEGTVLYHVHFGQVILGPQSKDILTLVLGDGEQKQFSSLLLVENCLLSLMKLE